MIILVLLALTVILETIPLSSSTHIALLKRFCLIPNDKGFTHLEYLMHGPMVIGIALFFYNRWIWLLSRRAMGIVKKIFLLGFITNLTTLMGFSLFFIKDYSIPHSFGFFVTSCMLISLIVVPATVANSWNKKNAALIGLAQGVAFLPGISRFAATFVTARWCNIKPTKAFEISFLVELPILFAACMKGCHGIYKDGYSISLISLLATTIISIGSMYAGFAIINKVVKFNYFWLFGVYTLVLSFISAVY